MTSSMRLFGMMRPTNRMFVQLVVELAGDQVVRLEIEVREVGYDRQHAGRIEAQRLELLPVELRVAECEIDALGIDPQLAASLEALLGELLVHVDEELRRRDVVVDEDLPVGHRVGDARRARSNREMVDQDVRRIAVANQIPIVARHVFEARVRRLDEDIRIEAGRSEGRAGCRAPRGRWRRRSQASPAPDESSVSSIQHRSGWKLREHLVSRASGSCAVSRATLVQARWREPHCCCGPR